jgi:uncharacterized protein (DUF2267 family)
MAAIREIDDALRATEDLIDDLMRRLAWHDRERVYLALLATLHALRDCLGRDEAVHVERTCRPFCAVSIMRVGIPADAGWLRRDKPFSRVFMMHRDLGVDAEQVARSVLAVLAARMPAPELEDAKAATPKELHNLWPS